MQLVTEQLTDANPISIGDITVGVMELKSGNIEAMAAAKPIVATAVGGNCELLENGKSALLVPPADPAAMAQALAALARDAQLANRLGQAARLRVDAYPDRVFEGRVTEIAQDAEFTPRQTLTQEERANLVFFVKVKILRPQGILKPGLPVDVELP